MSIPEHVRNAFLDFAYLRISFERFQECAKGYFDMSLEENVVLISDRPVKQRIMRILNEPIVEQESDCVILRKEMVCVALKAYLVGERTEEDLYPWANVLIMFDIYDSDLGDVELEVLHSLASPELYGEINPAIVRYYLGCIESGQMPTIS